MIEYKKIDHFVPFLQLETKDLQHVVKIMQCEVSTVPGKNRLYYFKNMTKVYIRFLLQLQIALLTYISTILGRNYGNFSALRTEVVYI